MSARIANVLIVFVLLVLAIHVGAGVYQSYATIGVAAARPPESLQTVPDQVWSGVMAFWSSGIHPAGLVAMIAATILLWRSPRRRWALIGLLIFAGALIATAVYYAPEARALFAQRGSGVPPSEISARVQRWIVLDRVRFVAAGASFLCWLRALVVPRD